MLVRHLKKVKVLFFYMLFWFTIIISQQSMNEYIIRKGSLYFVK